MPISELIEFVLGYRQRNQSASKEQIAGAAAHALHLTKHRSVYACDDFAVRFSAASGAPFANVVLSLSALRAFDRLPFTVAVIRPDSTDFLLANATFLRKISHSSHSLRPDHIRGSFLGHDILREYEAIENRPDNFDTLFAIHQEFTWVENVERLVEATNQIVGRGRRFSPNADGLQAIRQAPALAASLVRHPEYLRLKEELATAVRERSSQILEYARIDNVNQRGNLIEQAITGGINAHNLGDMVRQIAGDVTVQLEIKTKLMDRASSPKAYNIDKALEALGRGRTLIAFGFVGIYVDAGRVVSSTISILDRTVLEATRIQFHWAGRNSRGVTQLTGNFARVFAPDYQEEIDTAVAARFLADLLRL